MAEAEKDYPSYAAKDPTDLHTHLAEWIKEKTGYDPASARSKEQAYLKGVQLGALLRMDHQSSPENQKRRTELSKKSSEARETKAAEAAETPKKVGRPAKKAAKAAEAAVEEAPAAAVTPPAKKAGRPASGKRRGPRPAAAGSADTTGTPAPF